MRAFVLAATAAASLLGGCSTTMGPGGGLDRRWSRYDYNRPDPAYGGYEADRYYRDGPRYRERVLRDNDRVYVGRDGRYYCRRNDGTTGLIVGGIAGGVLGSIIAPGGANTLGAILGGGAGALAGRSIDRNNVRCR